MPRPLPGKLHRLAEIIDRDVQVKLWRVERYAYTPMNSPRRPLRVIFAILFHSNLLVGAAAAVDAPATGPASYSSWKHSGSIYLLTTPEGANLDAAAKVESFPTLIRLHKDFFDFGQAKLHGEDLRFSTPDGVPLAYQIDDWNPAGGVACVWVRVPVIKGTERRELKLHWGNPQAASESDGRVVFNASNGYVSVWHMGDTVRDDVGTLESKDTGTTPAAGIIGQARHFPGKVGVFGGDKISNYPAGASEHTSEAWFRAEQPNVTILDWGIEGGGRGGKVRMQLRSPPHLHIDSAFSDVNADSRLPLSEWIHVAHSYGRNDGRIYINGRLDGAAKPLLDIKSPARLWIGGWYNNYDFVGDIDEVRISSVARSADWVKLEFENQKPLQSLAGPLVQKGDEFSVTPADATVAEGTSVIFSAEAGGAQKVYWALKRDGGETVVAVNRFHLTFDAPRVKGDQMATLQFRAVYPTTTKTRDVRVTVKEAIPDPEFSLKAPAAWDGRAPVEVVAQVTNLADLKAAGGGDLQWSWNTGDIAVTKEIAPGRLLLTRAQNSGKLKITATAHNGGERVLRTAEIAVTEPAADAWVARPAAKDEQPEDNQFYARDDRNEGTLFFNGTLAEPADAVFLRVFANDQPYKEQRLDLPADRAYAFTVKLKPGLIRYKLEFGSTSAEHEKLLKTVNNVVCGDAFLINGQSNAEATAWGKEEYAFSSPWIRTYGSTDGAPQARG